MDIDQILSMYGILVPSQENNEIASSDGVAHRTEAEPSQIATQTISQNVTRSFVEAVAGYPLEGITLKEAKPPRVVRGNTATTVDEEEYERGLMEFRHNLIGRIIFTKDDKPYKS